MDEGYSVETYLSLQSIQLLDQRLKNLEPLIRVYKREQGRLKLAITNPEEGRKMVEELEKELDALKEEALKIMTAKAILMGR